MASFRRSLAVAAFFLECSLAEEDAAVEAAAPEAAPAGAVTEAFLAPTTVRTTTIDPDVLIQQGVQQAVADSLQKGQHCFTARRGAWLYGDHDVKFGVSGVVACAEICFNDPVCSHWNYHPANDRCDLKSGQGGFNEDAGDWVSGDCTEHVPAANDL